jgi:hypothetical protein
MSGCERRHQVRLTAVDSRAVLMTMSSDPAPICPSCQRPVQSRAAKWCSFCGKPLVPGEQTFEEAKVKRIEEFKQTEVRAAAITIHYAAAAADRIVAANGSPAELDAICGADKGGAITAYADAMLRHYTPERARAATVCECAAQQHPQKIVVVRWATPSVEKRRANAWTFFALFFGVFTWTRYSSWTEFQTFHPACATCEPTNKNQSSVLALGALALLLLLGAVFFFLAFLYQGEARCLVLSLVLLGGLVATFAARKRLQTNFTHRYGAAKRFRVLAVQVAER